MFDHQRALLGPVLCFAGLCVCIRKKISSHKRASLPLFNAVCVSVRESKLCCLNADVLCCSSGPLIQVTSRKSVSSSSFITHSFSSSSSPSLALSLTGCMRRGVSAHRTEMRTPYCWCTHFCLNSLQLSLFVFVCVCVCVFAYYLCLCFPCIPLHTCSR